MVEALDTHKKPPAHKHSISRDAIATELLVLEDSVSSPTLAPPSPICVCYHHSTKTALLRSTADGQQTQWLSFCTHLCSPLRSAVPFVHLLSHSYPPLPPMSFSSFSELFPPPVYAGAPQGLAVNSLLVLYMLPR